MTKLPAQLDFDQVSTERRATLELILVVLLLGLLVNAVVSALFVLAPDQWATAIMVISVVLSLIILGLFIPLGLLRRAELVTEIPVVLFFDRKAKTLSLPTEIHFPQPRQSGLHAESAVPIPFPIIARLYFDRFKRLGRLDRSDLSDILRPDDKVFVPLIQFIVLQHYIHAHLADWAPTYGCARGPFQVGSSMSLPATEYGADELRALSGNTYLQFLGNLPMSLPEGTDLEFSPTTVRLIGRLFRCELTTRLSSLLDMQGWPHALGTVSSWCRALSSDYSETHALLLILRIDFTLKVGLWRFFSEDWLPKARRPKATLRDITDWINAWVSSLHSYLDWIDEDLSSLPKAEVACLVDEAQLIYESLLPGGRRMRFGSPARDVSSAGSIDVDSEGQPTFDKSSGKETAKMSQRQSIESHAGSVDLECEFTTAVGWLRSEGQVELSTSKPTEFTAEAAVTQRGAHRGQSVIIFRQRGREFGRAYACCWRHYYNCNRTRIGMYCKALDAAIS